MKQKIVFIFLLFGLYLAYDSNKPKPNPLVIFHGVGDNCGNQESFVDYMKTMLRSYTVCIESGGTLDSFTTSFEKQAEKACSLIKANSNLTGNINVLGFSQGVLIARHIIEKCDFNGVVKRLISVGGPNAGVSGFPGIYSLLNGFNRKFAYSSFIQNHLGPAGYFKDPFNLKGYLEAKTFLSEINNEREIKDKSIKERFLLLEKIVLIKFKYDSVLIPKESAWFGFYAEDGNNIVSLEESKLYQNDDLGLKQLNEENKIEFVSVNGDHLQFDLNVIWDYFLKPLGFIP